MKSSPIYSVVMASYNTRPFIRQAVESVLREPLDLELIVVDDQSIDGSLNEITDIIDPRLKILREEHRGCGGTCNRGLVEARGRYVTFLDSDDVMEGGALARLAQALEGEPSAVVAYGDYWVIDEGGRRQDLRNWVSRRKPSGDVLEALLARNFLVNPGVVLARISALRDAGGFDPEIEMGVDWHLWCRLALSGSFVYVPHLRTVSWRQRAGSMTSSSPTMNHYLPVIDKVFSHPGISQRLSPDKLRHLRRRQLANVMCIIARKHLQARRRLPALSNAALAVKEDWRRLPHLGWTLLSTVTRM